LVNWRVTGDHLLLGTGPAGYAAYYMSLFPQEATATHSNYVDIIAQTGIVGMGFFVWFLVAMGVTARRAWRRVPKDGFMQALAAGCAGGYAAVVTAMSLGDWLLPFAYTQGINGYDYTVWGWVFMGVLVGMSHYQNRERTADDGH
jgi:O-antigen ligase